MIEQRTSVEVSSDRRTAVSSAEVVAGDDPRMRDVLGLWVELDERRYDFMVGVLGSFNPSFATWGAMATWAVRSGVAEWSTSELSIYVRRPAVGSGLRPTLDAPAMQAARRLMTQWFINPDLAMFEDVLRWAVLLEAWEAVARLWMEFVPSLAAEHEKSVRAILEDLPRSARASNPILTVAWAAARSNAAQGYRPDGEFIRGLVSDGLTYHSQWLSAPRTGLAVSAGSLWAMAQRWLPAVQGRTGLDEASRTVAELASFIAERRAERRPPGASDEAVFRAISAQIALGQGQINQAVAEAEFAITLDPRVGGRMAAGTRDLALELLGCRSSSLEPVAVTEQPAWFWRGAVAQDALNASLSRALAALARVDREATRSALAQIGVLQHGQPQWTFVASVQATAAAVWGDAATALGQLDAMTARQSVASSEYQEPMGSTLIRKARSLLLSRMGASAAALEGLRPVPAHLRWAPQALAHLWSGNPEEAVRTADLGIFDAATPLPDRILLKVVRAGSVLIDPEAEEHLRDAAVGEAGALCLDQDCWLPIAMLPASSRDAILDALQRRSGAKRVVVPADVLARLRALPRTGETLPKSIALTKREQTLLPLLATAESVPDIAANLQVSVNTVRKQVVSLRAKFGACSRSELVRKARDAGLLRR